MSKDTGGSAFPILVETSGGYVTVHNNGMTLHDYASLKILQGLMANPERYKYIAERIEAGDLTQAEATEKNIRKANKMADQWIAERNK